MKIRDATRAALREALQPLGRFYRWWLSALSAAMTRSSLTARPWDTLLLHGEGGLNAIDRSGPASTMRGDAYVVLRLSQEQVLERRIEIPKAARDVLEPVLRNQMDRLIPWPRHQTAFGFEILGGAANAPRMLDIRVVATTNAVIEAALSEARQRGFAPAVVDYAAPEAPFAGITLASLMADPREKVAARLHRTFVAALLTSLAVGGLGFAQVWRSAQDAQEIGARITAAREQLAAMQTLNAEEAWLAAAVAPIIARKAADPAVAVLIDALSRALPDSAYLTELEIRGGQVRLVGHSGEATSLIGLLEGTPQFENVAFAAPTPRDPATGLESFTIAARANGARTDDKGDAHAR